MKKFILAASLFVFSAVASAQQPFSPFNQSYTINQQYGSTNWYSSPLGQGVAQAGVLLMGGVVNAMSRPDPVVVQQQPQQPQYVQGGGQVYGGQGYGGSPAYGAGGYTPYYGYGYRPAPPNPYNQYPY